MTPINKNAEAVLNSITKINDFWLKEYPELNFSNTEFDPFAFFIATIIVSFLRTISSNIIATKTVNPDAFPVLMDVYKNTITQINEELENETEMEMEKTINHFINILGEQRNEQQN